MSDKKFLDQSGLNYVWQKIKSNDIWERGQGEDSVQVIGGNAGGAFSVSEGIVYEIEKLITIQHIVPNSDIDKYVISTLGGRFNYYCEYTFSEDINGNSIPSLISSGQIHEIIGDDQISDEPLCNIIGEFLLDNDISDDIASLFRLSRTNNSTMYSLVPESLKDKNILVFNIDPVIYLDTDKQYVLKCNTGVGINGLAAHNEGFFTLSDNVGSHSEGFNTVSNANGAHSEGLMTISKEIGAHSEGILNISSGIASHAEGSGTIASADYSHTEGYKTIAKGYTKYDPNASTSNSAVIGVGLGSHAEGVCTIASAIGAHAEGYSTTASGANSHAEGQSTIASGIGTHAEGCATTASGGYSHAEGYKTVAQGNYSHAEGEGEIHEYIFKQISENIYECISGVESSTSTEENKIFYLKPGMLFRHYYQNAEVTMSEFLYIQRINISDNVNEVEFNTTFTDTGGSDIVTELVLGISYGGKSHTEGATNVSFGAYSHAEGIANRSIGNSSHTEGSENAVFSISGHAEGHGNIIEPQALYSHAEGRLNNVHGTYAHAEGANNIASGYASHAEGYKNIANTSYSHAQGAHNVSNFGNTSAEQTLSSIGIGTEYIDENNIIIENRKNAVEVMRNGDMYLIGVGDYDGTNAVEPNNDGKKGQTLQDYISNIEGTPGPGLEYHWSGTELGVRKEGDVDFEYSDLVGPTGETGATGPGLEYHWSGTELGVKREDEDYFEYSDLVGPTGEPGSPGESGIGFGYLGCTWDQHEIIMQHIYFNESGVLKSTTDEIPDGGIGILEKFPGLSAEHFSLWLDNTYNWLNHTSSTCVFEKYINYLKEIDPDTYSDLYDYFGAIAEAYVILFIQQSLTAYGGFALILPIAPWGDFPVISSGGSISIGFGGNIHSYRGGNSILFYEDEITTDTTNKADVPTGFSVRVGDLVIDENFNLYKCIEEVEEV